MECLNTIQRGKKNYLINKASRQYATSVTAEKTIVWSKYQIIKKHISIYHTWDDTPYYIAYRTDNWSKNDTDVSNNDGNNHNECHQWFLTVYYRRRNCVIDAAAKWRSNEDERILRYLEICGRNLDWRIICNLVLLTSAGTDSEFSDWR